VKTGLNDAFWIDGATRTRILAENPEATEVMRPLVVGDNVRRYCVEDSGRWLLYMRHGVEIDRYPAVKRHLATYQHRLEKRATRQEWYELQQPQQAYEGWFHGPKLLTPDIAAEVRFAVEADGRYPSNTCYAIPGADWYLLAVLNSRLGMEIFRVLCAALEGGQGSNYLRFFGQYLASFPVRRASSAAKGDETIRNRLIVASEEKGWRALEALLAPLLPLDGDGRPDLARERSAPVRDLLAHLGERLTDLHAERQAITRQLGEWLEYAEIQVERLPLSIREGGWAELGSTQEVLAEFGKRRVRLAGGELVDCQRELNRAFERLNPVRHRISVLNDLTERVVRRLYGVHA
jgi:hypothetical protein